MCSAAHLARFPDVPLGIVDSLRKDLPFASYARVSRVGEREADERLRSPGFQRKLNVTFAKGEGIKLMDFPDELDVSGSRAKRPILDDIVGRIERGELGGIVVGKLDRLSRLSPRDRVVLFDRIESAGGVVLSASESNDISTPEGRLARELFLGIARYQWEKARDGFYVSKYTAVMERGAKVGPTPFGYVRTPGGVLAECPIEGPILRRTFEIAVSDGLAAAAEFLRAEAPVRVNAPAKRGKGTRRQKGRPRNWSHLAVRRLLMNRAYLGEVRVGKDPETAIINTTAHPPLITVRQFSAAQRVATEKRSRMPKADFPLAGVLLCHGCGEALVGSRSGTPPRRSYRCGRDGSRTDTEGRILTCSAKGWVNAEKLETYLIDWFKSEYRPRPAKSTDDLAEARITRIESELADAEWELDQFLADTTLRRSLKERYHRHAQERSARVEALRTELREVSAAAARGKLTKSELNNMSADKLRRALGRVGAQVFIRKAGRGVREVEPRVAIVLEDEATAVVAA